MVEHTSTEVRSSGGQKGEMRWIGEGNSEKVLHLRFNSLEKWEPYSSPKFRHIRQSDTVQNGIRLSQGFRTAQCLLTSGWEYV